MGKTPLTRVRLHRYRGRPYGLIWQYGRQGGEVSSGCIKERDALKAAGRLEEQLEAGQLPGRTEGLNITWADFRVRYELEWLEALSEGSRNGWSVAARHFETICNPRKLADIDKAMLSKFRGELEARDISPASARSYYRALRAGLGWAESMDLIDRVPTIRHRRQAKATATMRSRVINLEEFERMIAAVDSLKIRFSKESLKRFMWGLWHSGLRIDELNRLHWNKREPLHVNLDGRTPLIVFLGGQKNRQDTYLPAPREFWQIFTKRGQSRTGFVFPIEGRFGNQMTTRNIGRRIADAGRKARIETREGKCATAHDLRAAYLTRVAAKVTMSQTQAMARHSDPKTTSQFYVRHHAEELAEAMGW